MSQIVFGIPNVLGGMRISINCCCDDVLVNVCLCVRSVSLRAVRCSGLCGGSVCIELKNRIAKLMDWFENNY